MLDRAKDALRRKRKSGGEGGKDRVLRTERGLERASTVGALDGHELAQQSEQTKTPAQQTVQAKPPMAPAHSDQVSPTSVVGALGSGLAVPPVRPAKLDSFSDQFSDPDFDFAELDKWEQAMRGGVVSAGKDSGVDLGPTSGGTSRSSSESAVIPNVKDYVRLVAVEVRTEMAADGAVEKMVRCVDEDGSGEKVVILRDIWLETDLAVGDLFNAIGLFRSSTDPPYSPTLVLSLSSPGLLILHPDLLLSATSVAERCPRRAALDARVSRGRDPGAAAAVIGGIAHSVAQGMLVAGIFDETRMREEGKHCVEDKVEDVWSVGLDEKEATRQVESGLSGFVDWGMKFVGPVPQPDAIPASRGRSKHNPVPVSICKVVDIEETIWSPKLGLKGRIDATVQLRSRKHGGQGFMTSLAPLEIKTGKPDLRSEHVAQTMLYASALGERY
ncbi:Tripartite DNA replication factor, partial [Gonapodya sp. JEL0774]